LNMSQGRVLFVDDDPSIRRFVEMALETMDVTVSCCGSVSEAIEKLCEHGPVDLLVTDLMMPGDSGFDLLQRLRDEPALRGSARLAVFSAGLHGKVQAELARYGVWRQLSKPVSASELEECVRDAMAWAARPISLAVREEEAGPGQEALPPLAQPELDVVQAHFAGDLGLYQAFRDGCCRQFAVDLARGEASIQALDFEDLLHLAHSLKSVLLLLGHKELSDIARDLESRAARTEAVHCAPLWQRLAEGLARLTAQPYVR